MPRHARELHRRLDRAFAEAVARDDRINAAHVPGLSYGRTDISRPIRWRKDIIVSDATLLRAAKLWAKKSQKNGRQYLVGRLGGLRVLVFENADRKDDSDPSHYLMLGEAEDRPRPTGEGR